MIVVKVVVYIVEDMCVMEGMCMCMICFDVINVYCVFKLYEVKIV